MRAATDRVRRTARGVAAHSAELLAAVALLAGWAALTHALASVPKVWGAPALPQVWFASAGLFLLSCFGWGMLRDGAREGVYSLWRAARKRG